MSPSLPWATRMWARPSRSTRTLLTLYTHAAHGEFNIGAFLREHPELLTRLGTSLDLAQDDAALALALAPAVGRHKQYIARANLAERCARADRAAAQLAASARHERDRVVLDADVLLGDLLAGRQKYIALDLESARIPVLRHVLVRARGALRGFLDLSAFVDEGGLHLVWRAGRGGLNLRAQPEERGASVLAVDLRPRMPMRRASGSPVPLGDVLVELGLM